MSQRRAILGLVVLAIAGVLLIALWTRGPRPCRATFEQVREGMTLAEIEAVVGGPPGNYSDGYRLGLVIYDWLPPVLWTADDGELCVDFAADGRASSDQIGDVIVVPRPSWLNRLRARLGL
jgi:hypothetical protein